MLCFRKLRFLLSVVVFAVGSWQSAVAQNLILHWGFDETTGDVEDLSGFAPLESGTLGPNAVRSTDTPGGSEGFSVDLSAPGLDSFVEATNGDIAKADGLGALTISTWIKGIVDDTPEDGSDFNPGGSNNVRLLAKQGGGPNFNGFSFNLGIPNDGPPITSDEDFRVGLFVGTENGFQFFQSDADVEGLQGEWIFLATTYDGASTSENIRFYVGTETSPVVQLGSAGNAAAGGAIADTDAFFGVGFTDAALTADTAIEGFQDDVRLYDGALSLAQLDDVRREVLPDTVGLAGDFNENNVVDAADYTLFKDNEGSLTALPNDDGLGTPIDQAHYDLWVTHFGETAVGTAAGLDGGAIPEPASGALLLLAAAGGALLQRRF